MKEKSELLAVMGLTESVFIVGNDPNVQRRAENRAMIEAQKKFSYSELESGALFASRRKRNPLPWGIERDLQRIQQKMKRPK